MHQSDDFRIGLGTDVTSYAPVWRESFQGGQWEFDYTGYALARDGITLALTALNPAMGGLSLGATYFLTDIANWLSNQEDDSNSIYWRWDYTPLNGPEWADSSTFLLVRDELKPLTVESFTVQNTAVAFPEYPVITGFEISFTAPPDPGNIGPHEMKEWGVQKITANQPELSPHVSAGRNEEIYIADPQKMVEVSPIRDPEVPDRVYERIEEKRDKDAV